MASFFNCFAVYREPKLLFFIYRGRVGTGGPLVVVVVRIGTGGPAPLVVVLTTAPVVPLVGGPWVGLAVVPGGGRAVGTGLAVVFGGGLGDGTGGTGLGVVAVSTSQYCPSWKKYVPSGHLLG